jgi:probable rRNA maturation factor
LKIKIYYDNISFRLRKSGLVKKFFEKVIRDEKKIPGDLNFVFTGNNRIIEINKTYLRHDYFTDVIAFDYGEDEVVNGEIYISIDTVRSNAEIYGTLIIEEVLRVMIHGVLHLCGYDDRQEKLKEIMFRRQEEKVKEFFS